MEEGSFEGGISGNSRGGLLKFSLIQLNISFSELFVLFYYNFILKESDSQEVAKMVQSYHVPFTQLSRDRLLIWMEGTQAYLAATKAKMKKKRL